MTEILAFVLGVGAVAFVWVAVVAFKTAKLAEQNEQSIRNLEEWISRNDELVNRRIDQEINRVDSLYDQSIRHTDSRVDKLEAKLTSINNDGCKPVKKKLIKG
jgi:heme/copper-type cytochrome/quinol oxidase subunit 1